MLNWEKVKGKRICVAYSGGMDSSALLHYLQSLQSQYGYTLCAVHCEHGLRGEDSLIDMRFAIRTCQEKGIPLFVFQEDCRLLAQREKQSLETAARAFRQRVFRELIEEGKADYIATAHHQDDEVETVLFRLSRGTALCGLQAMQEEQGYILRPLLGWSKEKIEGYVKENGIPYCIDESNFEMDATRNQIRHLVLPPLEKAVEGAKENIVRFARLAGEDDRLLYKMAAPLLQEKDGKTIVQFCKEKPLFTRACLMALKAMGVDRNYTSLHLESIYLLQESENGASVDLPQRVVAKKTREGVYIHFENPPICVEKPNASPWSNMYFDGGRYEVTLCEACVEQEEGDMKILQMDADCLPSNAVFRFRREGDVLEKFGGGSKTLKKFFNEKRILVEEREYLPILAEEDGNRVFAVGGVEIADHVKVTNQTKRKLFMIVRKK